MTVDRCRRGAGAIPFAVAVTLLVVAPDYVAGQEERRMGWTSDRHALRVGDLVTVFVDESTRASADRTDVRLQNRSRNLSLQGGGDQGVSVGARSQADLGDRLRGESARRETFVTEVSARVVEVGPGGLVRVEGEKRIRIDGHEQVVTLSGWLRSADISSRNTVESWRIADADIRYRASGDMGRPRGILGRLVGWFWP